MRFKKISKFVLIAITVIVFVAIAASTYLLINVRRVFLSEIQKNLGVKATASRVRVVFPASLIVEDLRIGETIKVDKIIASPSFLSLVKGGVVLNLLHLERPQLAMARNEDNTFDFGLPLPKKKERIPEVVAPAFAKKAVAKKGIFYAAKIKIIDGRIDFTDKRVSPGSPFRLKFSNINLDISRPSVFQPFLIQFKGNGSLVNPENVAMGEAAMTGWADLSAKDMDAQLSAADVELVSLEPYYKKFLKKELASGRMRLGADFKSKNNDLKAECHLELSQISFKQMPEPAPSSDETNAKTEDLTYLVFDSLLSSQGGIVFDFGIRTKMDRPRLEHIKVKGAFLSSMAQAPQLGENFKDIGKQFKSIGKQFKSMFKNK
jgi:hypothetical protein